MNIYLEQLQTIELGNKGITIQVKTTKDKHMGRFIVDKTGVSWYSGKKKNENHADWDDLIEYLTDK